MAETTVSRYGRWLPGHLPCGRDEGADAGQSSHVSDQTRLRRQEGLRPHQLQPAVPLSSRGRIGPEGVDVGAGQL